MTWALYCRGVLGVCRDIKKVYPGDNVGALMLRIRFRVDYLAT